MLFPISVLFGFHSFLAKGVRVYETPAANRFVSVCAGHVGTGGVRLHIRFYQVRCSRQLETAPTKRPKTSRQTELESLPDNFWLALTGVFFLQLLLLWQAVVLLLYVPITFLNIFMTRD